jgi:hypothetical protein
MADVPNKSTGDSYTAAEFSQNNSEIRNSISDTGQTPDSGDLFQISKAMSVYAAGGNYFTDGGSANAYVISTVGSKRAPTAYFDGMMVRFRAANNNTGSSTVNVSALGVKDIKKADGTTALSAGDITTAQDAFLRFDLANNVFQLIPFGVQEATPTVKGISYLFERIILSNNSVDPDHDIDFSAGSFSFDDGSGQARASAMTKRLDALWSAGSGNGGRDAGIVANNTWYYCFAIYNPTNGAVDFLFSTSPTTPTMPAGYTKKKRVGAIRTAGGPADIMLFAQTDKKFIWLDQVNETPSPVAPASQLWNITVPDSIQTISHGIHGVESFNGTMAAYYPGSSSVLPNLAGKFNSGNWNENNRISLDILTNISGQIQTQLLTGGGGAYYLITLGWTDYQLEN